MSDNPQPPSQMIRVPTPLVEAVRELSRLHRQGHTTAVLTELQLLISAIDSSVAISDVSFAINDINKGKNDITADSNIDSRLISELISKQVQEELEPMRQRLSAVESELGEAVA